MTPSVEMHEEHRPIDIEQFDESPLLTSEYHASIGTNLNRPSVIRAPEWLATRSAGTTCTSPTTAAFTSG